MDIKYWFNLFHQTTKYYMLHNFKIKLNDIPVKFEEFCCTLILILWHAALVELRTVQMYVGTYVEKIYVNSCIYMPFPNGVINV